MCWASSTSDDPHDLMAETLAAGRRRLPSEQDLLEAACTLSGENGRRRTVDQVFFELADLDK